MADYPLSQRHASELMEIPRTTCRYLSRRDDTELRERLVALAQQQPRFCAVKLALQLQKAQPAAVMQEIVRLQKARVSQLQSSRPKD